MFVVSDPTWGASNKDIGPSENQKVTCFNYLKAVRKIVKFRFTGNSKEDFWRVNPPPEGIGKNELKKAIKVVDEVYALKEDAKPQQYIEKKWAECLKTTPR